MLHYFLGALFLTSIRLHAYKALLALYTTIRSIKNKFLTFPLDAFSNLYLTLSNAMVYGIRKISLLTKRNLFRQFCCGSIVWAPVKEVHQQRVNMPYFTVFLWYSRKPKLSGWKYKWNLWSWYCTSKSSAIFVLLVLLMLNCWKSR